MSLSKPVLNPQTYNCLRDPAKQARTCTPADNVVLVGSNGQPGVTRALFIGTSAPGDLTVIMGGDTIPVTFKNVPQGVIIPLQVSCVQATGTTVSDIVLLF